MSDLELTLRRRATVRDSTLGELIVDGHTFCYTLEDCVREVPGQPVASWKLHGRTAIPVGRYRVRFETSPKFGPQTPTLVAVPGFDFIRIHAGNDDANTDGCILLGNGLLEDPEGDGGNLTESRTAVRAFKELLVAAFAEGAGAWLTIENPRSG